MAWTCSSSTNEGLIAALRRAALIKTDAVGGAMLRVDRAWFVPAAVRARAYQDNPLPIGHNATISAPHMHAIMLELLLPHLKPRADVLDVGSGSGFLTTVLAELCGSSSRVLGVEHVPALLDACVERVRVHFADWLDSKRLTFVRGDGRDLASILPADAMFDVIHVGAAATESHSVALLPRLKPGGCLVVPVERRDTTSQVLVMFTKDAQGNVTQKDCGGVVFIPLTSLDQQLNS